MSPNIAPFEAAFGGREALVERVSHATAVAPEVTKALAMLENPDAASLSFQTILKRCGCSIAAFDAALRDAHIALKHAEAMEKMLDKLPEVMSDMADAAISRDEACICTKTLDGKRVPARAACVECHGNGIVRYRPDSERHRLVAEAAGFIKKGPAVAIQHNTTVTPSYGVGSFDRFVKASDAALEAKLLTPSATSTTVVDAEIISESNQESDKDAAS